MSTPEESEPANAIPDGEVDIALFLREIEDVLGEDTEDDGGDDGDDDGDDGDDGDAGVVDEEEIVDADQDLPNGHRQ
ncbi:hypothetical protein DFQ27_000298 [Actinomortierella ambigua]|uniref:Uncharacterized protein n=1 Tax=Actinomortierella ambigua TaxID=1343610 RepID=A0A9P6PMZ2_9FUNG|nr:hypothetical protein DFQ27_000298 [Actinomortierella ambigua]